MFVFRRVLLLVVLMLSGVLARPASAAAPTPPNFYVNGYALLTPYACSAPFGCLAGVLSGPGEHHFEGRLDITYWSSVTATKTRYSDYPLGSPVLTGFFTITTVYGKLVGRLARDTSAQFGNWYELTVTNAVGDYHYAWGDVLFGNDAAAPYNFTYAGWLY